MKAAVAIAGIALLATWISAVTPRRLLRVCADPNNLPFSNQRREGFENRIAALLAREMNADLAFTWWAQRRGFVRNTLNAGLCDVIAGVPAGFEMVDATEPYYRSTYVFVRRAHEVPRVDSLDSPLLRKLRIGVHLAGDDYTNTPPAHALARRHIIANVSGYLLTADYRQPNPPARLLDALLARDIDVAIAWGPLAGSYAKEHPGQVTIAPVSPAADGASLPFTYEISMGVRRGNTSLRDRLNTILRQRRNEIERILDDYGVPRVDSQEAHAAGA